MAFEFAILGSKGSIIGSLYHADKAGRCKTLTCCYPKTVWSCFPILWGPVSPIFVSTPVTPTLAPALTVLSMTSCLPVTSYSAMTSLPVVTSCSSLFPSLPVSLPFHTAAFWCYSPPVPWRVLKFKFLKLLSCFSTSSDGNWIVWDTTFIAYFLVNFFFSTFDYSINVLDIGLDTRDQLLKFDIIVFIATQIG